MKTIEKYTNVYDLFKDYGYPMTDDQADYFSGVDDYESFAYYIIDRKKLVLVDDINGDVLNTESLESFYRNFIKYYNETEVE